MTLTTSSNKMRAEFWETYRWALKKQRGMLVLLTLLLFMALPLILFLTLPGWLNTDWSKVVSPDDGRPLEQIRTEFLSRNYTSLLHTVVPAFAVPLVLLFAVILCVLLFDYMQSKRSVDLFHSLPIGRTPMLLGRWCAGLTILFVPLILNFTILEVTRLASGISLQSGTTPILVQMLWIMLMGTAAFTFCMMMAVCSGTTLDTVLSILGVNAGYPVLILLGANIAALILPGYNFDWKSSTAVMTALAPLPAAVTLFYRSSPGILIWWIFLTLAMLAASVFLYQRRKSETAENQFAFPIPKIAIRFLLTAAGGMALGLLFYSMSVWFLAGVLAGSLMAHVIVEAVYSRGFQQIKKSFAWYGVFAVAFCVFYGVLVTGFFGYDTRLPNIADVQSVVMDNNRYGVEGVSQSGCDILYDENNHTLRTLTPVIRDPGNIQALLDVQKQTIDLYRSEGFPYRMERSFGAKATLTYRLKNGRTMTRTYEYKTSDDDAHKKEYQALLKKMYSLPEYLKGTDMIFYVDPTDIKSIDFNDRGSDDVTIAPDANAKKEILDALRQDFLDGKINFSARDKAQEVIRLQLNFRDGIEPKDDRLKQLLGSYKGKINLGGGGYYSLYEKDTKTYNVIQKYGWIK